MEWKDITPTPPTPPKTTHGLRGKEFEISIYRVENDPQFQGYAVLSCYGLFGYTTNNANITDLDEAKAYALSHFRGRLAAALAEVDAVIEASQSVGVK